MAGNRDENERVEVCSFVFEKLCSVQAVSGLYLLQVFCRIAADSFEVSSFSAFVANQIASSRAILSNMAIKSTLLASDRFAIRGVFPIRFGFYFASSWPLSGADFINI